MLFHCQTAKRLFVLVSILLMLTACGGGGQGGGSDDDDTEDPGIDAVYIFDTAYFHTFEVELAPADWDWLKANATLEEYVPATVIFEGQRYEMAAIRFKGDWGSLYSCFDDTGAQICPKLSIKLSFNEYEKRRFFGLRKLIFNSSVRDSSLMHEVLGYSLFRDMGVRAPRATHAILKVNGENLGVFVLVEQIDKEFVQDYWEDNDEGNLYKQIWPQYDEPEPYIDALETNQSAPDVSRMVAFYEAVKNSTDESFVDDLGSMLDFEYLARYLAVDRAINNGDGIQTFYCFKPDLSECANLNYYWYDAPQSFITLMPWDLDYTFNDINTDLGKKYFEMDADTCTPVPFCEVWDPENCDPETEEVFLLAAQCDSLYGKLHRATWNAYLQAIAELARGPMSLDVVGPKLDAIRAKIRDAVAADAFGPGIEEFDEKNAGLDFNLEQQIIEIEKLLASEGL